MHICTYAHYMYSFENSNIKEFEDMLLKTRPHIDPLTGMIVYADPNIVQANMKEKDELTKMMEMLNGQFLDR